ncbi:hypothetical protein M405DRAFT_332829 [Rhizopogon salebrosus TDB-379]|nr:hypothetical protein M405DRAFT_332829 [Rhizopogon salebrosus TDB-379]
MVSSAGNNNVHTWIHCVLWGYYYVIFFVLSFAINHDMYLVFIVVTLLIFHYLLHSKYACLHMFGVDHSPKVRLWRMFDITWPLGECSGLSGSSETLLDPM